MHTRHNPRVAKALREKGRPTRSHGWTLILAHLRKHLSRTA